MAAAESNRKCSACGRTLSSEDEWISLDGGQVWCAECWQEQFGPEPQAPAEKEPRIKETQPADLEGLAEGEQVASDQMGNLRPCTNCGHLCAPGTEICPACGGDPFQTPPDRSGQSQGTAVQQGGVPSAESATTHEWQDQAGTGSGSRVVHQINIGGQPQSQQSADSRKSSGLAVASLVLGIIGIVLLPLFVPQVLALIFGAVAWRDVTRNPGLSGKGMAIAGLILGIIGAALWFIWIVVLAEGRRAF